MKANKTKTNFTDLIYQHLRFVLFHYFVCIYLTLFHFSFTETIRLSAEYFLLEYYHQDSIWQTSSRQFIFILFVS